MEKKCNICSGTGVVSSSIVKINDKDMHVLGHVFKQTIDGRMSYLNKGYLTLKKIKRLVGAKQFNQFTDICDMPLKVSITWLREYEFPIFKNVMLDGLGALLLDIRIKKNTNIKSKRAQLLRDLNYKELFGVERAIELHPCYFDTY